MEIVSTGHGHVALGDCFDLLPLVEPASVDLVLADLPYAVTANKKDIAIDLSKLWPLFVRAAKPTTPYVFTAQMPFSFELYASKREWFRYDLVWDKALSTGFLNAKRAPLRLHEHVLVFCAGASVYNPQKSLGTPNHGWKKRDAQHGGANYGASTRAAYDRTDQKYPTSILHFRKPHPTVAKHPTEKPVELFEWLIKTYSNEGDVVLDPTCGSGTTAVACMNTNRRFIVMDKDSTCFETTKGRVLA